MIYEHLSFAFSLYPHASSLPLPIKPDDFIQNTVKDMLKFPQGISSPHLWLNPSSKWPPWLGKYCDGYLHPSTKMFSQTTEAKQEKSIGPYTCMATHRSLSLHRKLSQITDLGWMPVVPPLRFSVFLVGRPKVGTSSSMNQDSNQGAGRKWTGQHNPSLLLSTT